MTSLRDERRPVARLSQPARVMGRRHRLYRQSLPHQRYDPSHMNAYRELGRDVVAQLPTAAPDDGQTNDGRTP